MTEFKQGQRILISNPIKKTFLKGCEGVITEAEPSIKITVDGGLGDWYLTAEEIEPIGKKTNTQVNKTTESTKTEKAVNTPIKDKKSVKTAEKKPKEIKITKRGPYRPRQPKTI